MVIIINTGGWGCHIFSPVSELYFLEEVTSQMNDFFLHVYLLSQLTKYRIAILRLSLAHQSIILLQKIQLSFRGTLGVWGVMSQVSLIVLLKEFISDFLEYLLSGKRTVCLGIASSLK